MFNLYDLTKGDYRVSRALSYPDLPGSLILFDVQVVANGDEEWVTEISLNGTYEGPTDVVAATSYELAWMSKDGRRLLESGSAGLALSSGNDLRQQWSSIITPGAVAGLERFPEEGQILTAAISPFEVDSTSMAYEWSGEVTKRSSRY